MIPSTAEGLMGEPIDAAEGITREPVELFFESVTRDTFAVMGWPPSSASAGE
jgi:hypothetical protein